MSGPVSTRDVTSEGDAGEPAVCNLEIEASREAEVGGFRVRRALPKRGRRTVGPWCFADHMGPGPVSTDGGLDIGPHPHIGLQTVTWLLRGEILHRDSLGSEQPIRPGQLNLMTAGRGVAHAETTTGTYAGDLHGVQLWVAQPAATRDGDAAFEHHPELPHVELGGATATVLVGPFGGASSPARRDTEHVGVDLDLGAGTTVVPLEPAWEYAVVVLSGAVSIGGNVVAPGQLGYLGLDHDDCPMAVTEPTRALLLGGLPFEGPILMWWNYVARTHEEIVTAHRQWTEGDVRFGAVASPLPRIDVPPPPWTTRAS